MQYRSHLNDNHKAGHTLGDMSRNMLRNMHVTGHVAGHVPSVWQNVPMFNVFRNMLQEIGLVLFCFRNILL